MIQVYVSEGFFADQVKIHVVNRTDDGRYLMHYDHDGGASRQWTRLDDGAALVDDPPAPTLILDQDSARALLDSLTRFYHGAEDTRALRRDYDAERKRVDEQAQTIADIARTLAAQQGTWH